GQGATAMTEAEWLDCTDPQNMLEFLRGKVSERKLRLFACACGRQGPVWRLLTGKENRRTVEASERFADGLITGVQLASTARLAFQGTMTGASFNPRRLSLYAQALRAALETSRIDEWEAAYETQRMTTNLLGSHQGVILLEIFGSLPFRPIPIAPAVLAWNDTVVVRLAQTAYEERHLPDGTLDNSRLAVLADALEEAGCADTDILGHLRGPGPHVRGCWAVDLLLGKS